MIYPLKMVMFNSYVKLPEGNHGIITITSWIQRDSTATMGSGCISTEKSTYCRTGIACTILDYNILYIYIYIHGYILWEYHCYKTYQEISWDIGVLRMRNLQITKHWETTGEKGCTPRLRNRILSVDV